MMVRKRGRDHGEKGFEEIGRDDGEEKREEMGRGKVGEEKWEGRGKEI